MTATTIHLAVELVPVPTKELFSRFVFADFMLLLASYFAATEDGATARIPGMYMPSNCCLAG